MRIIFMGTPDFAVPSLQRLIASGHSIVGVVTQPDRPRGRGHHVTPSPVKHAALGHQLPVLQPSSLKEPSAVEELRALGADLGVVAAYGKLLPQSVLDLPARGMINVHASLLPRWRGAAPIHRAVLAGDSTTGVTIMRVVLKLDAGPALAHVATDIEPDETSEELEHRLATLGADLLVDVVNRMSAGVVPETPQDESAVTYAERLKRDESQIDWARPAPTVHNQIRGLQPWPSTAAVLNGHRIQFLRSTVEHTRALAESPGTIVAVSRDGLVVATRPGAVRLLKVQEAGRAAVSISDYLNGRRVTVGDRLESPAAGS